MNSMTSLTFRVQRQYDILKLLLGMTLAQRGGRAAIDDAPALHEGDAVAQRFRLLDIMRGQDNRASAFARFADERPQRVADGWVEAGSSIPCSRARESKAERKAGNAMTDKLVQANADARSAPGADRSDEALDPARIRLAQVRAALNFNPAGRIRLRRQSGVAACAR